jgi:hypothetical protein
LASAALAFAVLCLDLLRSFFIKDHNHLPVELYLVVGGILEAQLAP